MSCPRYPSYKDSGVEWLGQVPAHWSLPKLKSVASFSGGGTPSREKMDYWNGDIPWVSPKDMKAERVVGAEESITEEGLRNSASNMLPPGRVLMVVRSGILKHTIPVAINETAVALNQDMKALNFDATKCNGRFFLRWVQGHNDQLLLAWAKQGATVESIEHTYLADTVLPLPDVSEQTAIAEFLDRETGKIDELVAEQQRLMELLDEKIKSLVLSSFDAPDTVRLRLSEASTIISRPVTQKADESYTRIGLFNRGRGLFHKDASEMDDMGESDFFWVEVGDLIISGQFAWEGAVALADKEDTGCVVSHRYPVLRGKSGVALTEYLLGLLCTKHGDFLLNENSRGAAGRNRPLNISSLMKEKIPVPNMEAQKAVARVVHARKTLFKEIMNAIDLLQERRTALISAAVTGQIDVRSLTEKNAA